MESTIKLTETQQSALELVKRLSNEGKIDLAEAVQLIIAIYENKPEYVYIPYQNPWIEPYRPWTTEPYTTPPYRETTTSPYDDEWWKRQIWCTSASSTDHDQTSEVYAINGPKRNPFDWANDSWIG